MKQICEVCQQVFECQPTNIEQCQCYQWELSEALRATLAKQYQHCLCASCLEQLGAVPKKPSFASKKKFPS